MAAQHKASLLLLLSVQLLLVRNASADVFLSIDCGSSEYFSDDRNIVWDGDDLYIGHGKSVTLKNPTGSIARPMDTLRVFGSRRKSCYAIPVSGGGRVLARASFYYGDYDGKSSPPKFALQFDANEWATVATTLDGVVWYEAIYDVSGDSTSICVAQTRPGELPFVSAIEVRSLAEGMYAQLGAGQALLLTTRVAFGAPDVIRYIDDIYDRIWRPVLITDGITALSSSSDAYLINADTTDKPPVKALQTAVSPTQQSAALTLLTNLPKFSVPVYMNLYFSEMTELDTTQNRSFQIYIDGVNVSEPVVPPYQGVIERHYSIMANSSTKVALEMTGDANLPPVISAMEVFVIIDALSSGTYANDVETLRLLQQEFLVLLDWNGDPCLPASYNWEWVNCSTDETPRITALYLAGFGLTGFLPDLSALDALETIDLHNNSFSGDIPDFLANFPNLRELNLADNNFIGSVPAALTQNSKLKLDVSGNPDLCMSSQSCDDSTTGTSRGTYSSSTRKKKGSNNLGLALGLSLPLSFVVCAALATFFFLRRNRNDPVIAANGHMNGNHSNPSAPHQAVPAHAMEENGVKIEIQRQMENELADLTNQQGQAYQDGTITNTNWDSSYQEERALRYQ